MGQGASNDNPIQNQVDTPPSVPKKEGFNGRPDYRNITDCKYYVADDSCNPKNGEKCLYRHNEQARASTEVCPQWTKKKCLNSSCPYRHPGGMSTSKGEVPTDTKDNCERNVEQLLYDEPSHKITLDVFVSKYTKKFGPLEETYYGYNKLSSLLESMSITVKLGTEEGKRNVCLCPVRLFACEIKELLRDHPSGMGISAVNPNYKAKFQRDFSPNNYGFSKLIAALEAIQDVIDIEGDGPSRVIKLKAVKLKTKAVAKAKPAVPSIPLPVSGALVGPSDVPTVKLLTSLPCVVGGVEKDLNIIQRTNTSYIKLAMFLLEDENCHIVDGLEKQYHRNGEDIVTAVYKKWIAGTGKKPTSWQTLVDVLKKIELSSLAEEIVSNLKSR